MKMPEKFDPTWKEQLELPGELHELGELHEPMHDGGCVKAVSDPSSDPSVYWPTPRGSRAICRSPIIDGMCIVLCYVAFPKLEDVYVVWVHDTASKEYKWGWWFDNAATAVAEFKMRYARFEKGEEPCRENAQ
jgi:hypothetical protein